MKIVVGETYEVPPSDSVHPLTWGFYFAVTQATTLMRLALIPALIDVAVAYLFYTQALPPQQVFLIVVMSVFANSWLLLMVVSVCVQVWREDPVRLLPIMIDSLRSLPKVLFSYVTVLLFVPLFVMIFFFVWAPVFCAFELFVPQRKVRKPEPEELDDELAEFTQSRIRTFQRPGYFADKSLIELGFLRSTQFALRHVRYTIEIIVLIWCTHVIPAYLLSLLSPESGETSALVVRLFVSSMVEVLAIGCACSAFLVLLPPEAKQELALSMRPPNLSDRKFDFSTAVLILP